MARAGDRLLRSAVRHDRGTAALLLFTALLAAAASVLLPTALADAVDSVLSGDGASARVLWLVSLGAAQVLAEVAGVALTARLTAAAAARLRALLATALVRSGGRSPVADGDAVSRMTGDCAGAGQIVSVVVQLCTALLLAAGAAVALVLIDWRVALVLLVAVPAAVLLARSHLRHTADDVLAYQEAAGSLGARLLDAVLGLRTIAAAGVAEQESARVLRPLPELSAAGAGMWRTQARMMWRGGLLLPLVQVAVLCAAGFGVLAGDLSVGDVLAALGYATLALGIVRQLPQFTALSRARSCADRIAALLDHAPPPRPRVPLPRGSGQVELSGVGVDGALDDIDLVVPGGDVVAVVGRSGSGKSALAEVLGGLREPDRGDALLDGVPVGAVERTAVGYSFERPALLGESVAAAVAYGSGADDAAVRSACRTADIDDLVTRLPSGYATPLSETPLSGGEAQRLGLARALARRPRLLVLDDAAAALDTATEARVENAVADEHPGLTRVVVTHRACTARRADSVVWLEAGCVRAFAPHDALMDEPTYRALFAEEVQP
ncbi:ATP-binding cassette subfamily B protein [Saccharopolyspora erythraea NRRL 2338]|uniref:ABC transporter n=3 Tax=Saccharopolyspora erythraea TaxID=1836 RepID=A4FHH6_SACEN|nr:ABC transporter ATP-binding protein [Saccharopolyspora erythraea]PFG97194.1 ATP-binding cassette subfamily B protein [Saccharopolyspora erythraea NRRL 2338]QRK87395.1 ABC transporter ATP-binding protein [Saccharopolyspora erythraea]CAM03501.1 putative ABC transporter [Saccharopolyspora erythraea NRRL 2338]